MRSRDVAAVAIAALTACSLTTDLRGFSSSSGRASDGSSSGAASSSGGEGGQGVIPSDGSTVGTFDTGPDAAKGEVLASGGVVVATDASNYAAGSPQQHHVHFATNLGA